MPSALSNLETRRIELLEQLATASRDLDALRAARADDNADDEHDPEGSTLSSDWSRLIGLQDAARAQLDDVERAVQRAHDGTYGICVSCGRPIPVARLEARPAADRCIDCAS